MDHPTTTWAHQFGLPDPGVPADAVLAARPDHLYALAARLQRAAEALSDGAAHGERALAALRAGWSTPQALLTVQGLVGAADAVADSCRGNAAALQQCADSLAQARSAVQRAYADADASIAAQGLLSHPLIALWPHLEPRQLAVVQALYASTAAEAAHARTVAARLSGAIGPDPRPRIPLLPAAGPGGSGAAAAADPDGRNRAALAADLTSPSPARRAFAGRVDQALRQAADVGGAAVELLVYEPDQPDGQGATAIGIGRVSTADQVAVLVPGVGNSPSDVSSALEVAASLSGAAATAAPGTSTATVLWLGYDVPLSWPHDSSPVSVGRALKDSVLALDALDASVGGVQLAAFCRQLRGEMTPSAGLTLIGHSYGSTVVSQAALRLDRAAGVDDIVLLASPGAGYGVATAADYRAVPADHVYALAFPADPIPSPGTDIMAQLADPFGGAIAALLLGGDGTAFGRNPTSAGYGAQVIDAQSGVAVEHGPASLPLAVLAGPFADLLAAAGADPVNNVGQHSIDNYLGGAALTAVAAVVVGAYASVPVRRRR